MLIADQGRIRLAGNETRDRIHRAGTVECVDGGDVADAGGAQLLADIRHAGRFHLKHAGGSAGGQHLEHRRVVIRDPVQVKLRLPPVDHVLRIVQHRQVAQGQKVHLQQTQFLQRGRFVLGDNALVVAGQRHIGVDRSAGNDHARCVLGGVAGHSLDGLSRVNKPAYLFLALIHFPQGFGDL